MIADASRGSGRAVAVLAPDPFVIDELCGRQVTVGAIAPGPAGLLFEGGSREQIGRFARLPSPERPGTPEQIADVASLLAGPQGWTHGQVVRANGGYV